MLESAIQYRIIKYLEKHDWYVLKVIAANRSGPPDLICCAPCGSYVGIEVKRPGEKPTKLQGWHAKQIVKAGGIAAAVTSLAEVVLLVKQLERTKIVEKNTCVSPED